MKILAVYKAKFHMVQTEKVQKSPISSRILGSMGWKRQRVNHLSGSRQLTSGERVNLFRTDSQMLKNKA